MRRYTGKQKTLPMENHGEGGFWQRPTLAQPIEALPSGLQRFTSVFGMGTGGSTALGSPEFEPLGKRRPGTAALQTNQVLTIQSLPNFQRRTATNVVFLHICIEAQLPTG